MKGNDWLKNLLMSSSSSRGDSGARNLRYQYKLCDCRRKAKVKIVESEKPSKGMLYFVCERDECRFFSWCNPIYRDETGRGNFFERPMVEEQRPMVEEHLSGLNSNSEVKNLNDEVKNLKVLVSYCLMVSIFSLLLLLMKMSVK